jgi:peptide/nickel transport system ATP-binding protein
VGESGAGKSMIGRAIARALPPGFSISGGTIRLDGEDLIAATPARMRALRGQALGFVPQEPMAALNPVMSVGAQIAEHLRRIGIRRAARRDHAAALLEAVHLPDPGTLLRRYPHELSGGMCQRVLIAMAFASRPRLVVADEPTTALDVTTEANILDLMRELQSEIHMSIMFVTHNLGVVAQMCDEVVVMYLGRVVERASVDEIFYDPKHPYTQSLLRSIPRLGANRKEPLQVIRGTIPDPYSTVTGCPFHDRCPAFIPGVCDRIMPDETSVEGVPSHTVRCHLYTEVGRQGAVAPAAVAPA